MNMSLNQTLNTMYCVQILFRVVLFMMFCSIHPATAIIRYYSNENFETKNVVHLEHVDTGISSRQWSVSSQACQFSSTTTQTTELSCSIAGLHIITLDYNKGGSSGTLTKRLNIGSRQNCYQWHFYETKFNLTDIFEDVDLTRFMKTHHLCTPIVLQPDPSESPTLIHCDPATTDRVPRIHQICIWIVDPRYMSPEEINWTAESPSMHSSYLTDQFYVLGQRPRLDTYSHGLYLEPLDTEYLAYMEDLHCWLFAVRKQPDWEIELQISGETIPLYNCFVKDTFITIADPSVARDVQSNDTFTSLTISMDSQAIQHPCHENVLAFASSDGILWTIDGFTQTEPIDITLLDSANDTIPSATVSDLVVTFNSITLLTTNAIHAVNITDSSSTLLEENPVATSLTGRHWCCSNYSGRSYNEMVLAWSADSIHILMVDRPDRSILSLPTSGFTDFKVLAVAFSSSCDIIGVVAKVTSGSTQVAVYMYSMSQTSWQLITTLSYINGQSYDMQFVWTGTNKLLLWTRSDIYFITYKVLTTEVSVQPIRISPSVVKYVTQNIHGDIIIVSTTGEVYSTTSLWDDIIKLSMTVSSDDVAVPWFSKNRQLKMLSADGNTVQLTNYPLYNEILNAVYPDILCHFFPLKTSYMKDQYHMEINTSLTVWASMVYSREYYSTNSSFLQFVLDGDDNVCTVTKDTTYTLHPNFVMENLTVTFENSKDIDYFTWVNDTGAIGFTISPESVSPVCQKQTQTASFITTGCRPYLRYDVRGKIEQYSCFASGFFENLKYFALRPDGEIALWYDYERFGCAIQHDRYYHYLPDVWVCTFDECEPMTANYVIWEEHHQEFSYNTSMIRIGCQRPAQTWATMLAASDSENKSDVWGPHNYQECFIQNASLHTNLALPYEVLNSSGNNGIIFPDNAESIYLFHLRVVDPDFSFCDIEHVFPVYVYGSVPHISRPLTIIGFVILFILMLITFCCSYCHFRNNHFNVDHEMTDEWLGNREQLLANLGFIIEDRSQPIQQDQKQSMMPDVEEDSS